MTLRLMLAAVAMMASAALTAQDTLVILYTNDTHSTVRPVSQNLADTLIAGRGGYLRRMELVREQREQSPGALLFDSGDFSQGSPFYTLFKGDVEVGLMNMMGYDAATIGNHEFDFGLDNLARLASEATFPIVCANYGVEGTPLDGLVKPYVVLTRGATRVGVFGLSPRLEGLAASANYEGVDYLDPIAAANDAAAQLREGEGCDVVVCLSHLGWGAAPGEVDDSILVASTRGIDIVLGGHSHTYFEEMKWVENADGHPVPIDQNGKHGVFVGRVKLAVGKD